MPSVLSLALTEYSAFDRELSLRVDMVFRDIFQGTPFFEALFGLSIESHDEHIPACVCPGAHDFFYSRRS